jgi:hypothetical protein
LVANPLLGLKHSEADTSTGQLVRRGEAGLAPAHDYRLQLLNVTHFHPPNSVLMYSLQ